MKAVEPGHHYILDNHENDSTIKQPLVFISKGKRKDGPLNISQSEGDPDEFVTYHNGTTNEEVLRVLINRMEFLNNKFRCEENIRVIKCLMDALFWLNRRTAERETRGVEGKHEI